MAAPDPHSLGVPRPQFPRLCPACLASSSSSNEFEIVYSHSGSGPTRDTFEAGFRLRWRPRVVGVISNPDNPTDAVKFHYLPPRRATSADSRGHDGPATLDNLDAPTAERNMRANEQGLIVGFAPLWPSARTQNQGHGCSPQVAGHVWLARVLRMRAADVLWPQLPELYRQSRDR